MKKSLILTSVLALAACGGGGHGGSVATSDVRQAVTAEAIASNQKITSMKSEILIAEDGSITSRSATTPLNARSGTITQDGKTYTSYRLDDVRFKFGGEDSQIKFEVDNKGQIIALTKMDRSDDFTGDPTYAKSQEGTFIRKSSNGTDFAKNLYVYGFELNNAGLSSIASEHFDDVSVMADSGNLSTAEIKAKMIASINKDIAKVKASQDRTDEEAYQAGIAALETARLAYIAQINAATSFGNPEEVYAVVNVEGVNAGLKYADLGFAELTVKESPSATDVMEHSFTPYVGGYDALKVNPSELSGDTTFSGTVVAGIDHKRKGYSDSYNVEEGVLVRQDDATLVMRKNGSSTLTMDNLVNDANPSQHWYTVQVDRDTAGLPTFTISGTNTITGTKQGVEAYNLPSGTGSVAFTANQWRAHDQEYVKNTGINPGQGERFGGVAEATVYGTNANDMEATSRFGFSNEVYENGNHDHNEVAIYGAFSGKKQ